MDVHALCLTEDVETICLSVCLSVYLHMCVCVSVFLCMWYGSYDLYQHLIIHKK